MLERLKNRIMNMIGRCVITAAKVGDDGVTLQVNLLADENRDDIELFQQYGMASVPLKGAEGVSLFLGGSRDHGVVIATEDSRYRLKGMKGGEVALYTDEGDKIHFKRGNVIEIETKTLNVKAQNGVNFETSKVSSSGDIADSGGTLADLRFKFEQHIHTAPPGGGPTTGPIAPPATP